MSSDTFVYVTYIRTTPEKLWAALITPEVVPMPPANALHKRPR